MNTMGRNGKHLGHKRCHECNSALVFCKQDLEVRQGVGDWKDEKYWWVVCGCGNELLIGNIAWPLSTYTSSNWYTEGAVRVQVGRVAYSRGAGWGSVLHNRPTVILNGHVFQPRNHDFRKDHGGEYRAWYVARFVSEDCTVQPVQSPPPVPYWGRFDPYSWATWEDYDGEQISGFTQPDY